MRRHRIGQLLLAVPFFALPLPLPAGDWDLDRGAFVSDAEKDELRGRVRGVEEHTYSDGKITGAATVAFDAGGNRLRREYFAFDWKGCGVDSYDYDRRGFLVARTSQSGDLHGPNDCRNLRHTAKETFTYVTDGRGAMTGRRGLDASGKRTWDYDYGYDAQGRLASVQGTSSFGDRWSETYSYKPDPRGMLVLRTHDSKVANVSSSVTRALLFSAQGRLLEISQTPDGSLIFGSGQSRSYLANGGLAEIRYSSSQAAPAPAVFSGHDANGNWATRTAGGERVQRLIRY